MQIKYVIALTLQFALSLAAHAEEPISHIITSYIPITVGAKSDIKETVVGIINMDEISLDPLNNCSQFVHPVKVAGIQYSASGTSLEGFRYIHKDVQWVVQTNFGLLSNAERSLASNWIRVGRKYLVHFQACGSGGYTSLINMYEVN